MHLNRGMDKLFLRSFHVPSVFISSIREDANSPFLHPYQLNIKEAGSSHQFEFLPQRDSVAILLFQRKNKRFMVVRQFRPAVFVSRVLQLPHNRGKTISDIDWANEDRAVGCTLELCSGHVDNSKKDLDETALAVIEDEFGIIVDKKDFMCIDTFITGESDSGARCHLYYAEVDDAQMVNEGNITKRDYVFKVWLSVGWAESVVLREKDPQMTSAHYYALVWWFQSMRRADKILAIDQTPESPESGEDFRCPFINTIQFEREKKDGLVNGEWKCERSEEKGRYPVITMDYVLMGIDKTRDIVARPDTVSILIKDLDSMELVMTRRFRPAMLVGRVRSLPENEDKPLDQIDLSAYPRSWAYTHEMASGRIRDGETAGEAVRRVARFKLGYFITEEKLKFHTRLLADYNVSGASTYVYYAECSEVNRVKNFKGVEGVEAVNIPRWVFLNYIKPSSSPASVYVALRWMVKSELKITPRQRIAELEVIEMQQRKEDDRQDAIDAAKEREMKKEVVEEEGDQGSSEMRKRVAEENNENEPDTKRMANSSLSD